MDVFATINKFRSRFTDIQHSNICIIVPLYFEHTQYSKFNWLVPKTSNTKKKNCTIEMNFFMNIITPQDFNTRN